jgi:hypothetical protein
MPQYALVIDDVDKAWAGRRRLAFESYRRAGMSELRAHLAAEALEPTAPRVGDLWTTAASECPDGFPNCRHCGDPQFAASCAGHCPLCGTAHGIAPASVLEKHGLVLVELSATPTDDQEWDPETRAFIARARRPVD